MQPTEDPVFRHRQCPVNDNLTNPTPVTISVTSLQEQQPVT